MTIMTAADATATPNGVGHGDKAASAGNRDDATATANSPLSTSIHQRIPVDLPIPLAEAGGGSSHHLHHHHQHHPSATVDNPLPHVLPEGENATPLEVMGSTASDKLVIIMVGLPATGKTHIAKRICRFLSFFHDIPSQIFNVGDYRRQLSGAQQPAEFYSASNPDGVAARTVACDAALSDLCDYVSQDGVRVAAFDATNTSFERRQHIIRVLKERGRGIKKMFVESMCDDEAILRENIQKVKLSTPDYKDMDPELAVQDFMERRENYSKVYEPVTEKDGPFCKIINSKQFIVNNIRGYLSLKVVHYVMNLHTLPRTFYLTRHGQSEYNLLGKIGGDSGLTPAGMEYARRLAIFAREEIAKDHRQPSENADDSGGSISSDGGDDGGENADDGTAAAAAAAATDDCNTLGSPPSPTQAVPNQRPCRLWTSTLRRTQETAQFIQHDTISHTFDNGDTLEWVQFRMMPRRNLDELYAGTCDGMTYREIQKVYPEEFARRQADKLSYRYPRGESYMDVTLRLEPLAQEMERTREPVMIIGHQGILRILYAYFMGLDRKEAPYVSIPLNNVIELTPHAYGCHERRYCLMMKEEMLKDGQDEPVTSMPMGPMDSHHPHTGDIAAATTFDSNAPPPDGGSSSSSGIGGDDNNQALTAAEEAAAVRAINSEYSPSDPIMNAPSC